MEQQTEEIQEQNTGTKPEQKLDQPKTQALVEVGDKNYLEAKTMEGRWRLATAFIQGEMVPKSYKNPGQVFAGMELAAQLGLPPLVALKNIAVINGSPSLWGDLPKALCERSGKVEKFEEIIFDKDYKEINFANKNLNAEAWGAVCRLFKKNGEVIERYFTLDNAKTAGLLGRDNVWKSYPRRMLQMRARSQAIKDGCPEVLLGMDIAEYDHNYVPDIKDVTPKVNRQGEEIVDNAQKLNTIL